MKNTILTSRLNAQMQAMKDSMLIIESVDASAGLTSVTDKGIVADPTELSSMDEDTIFDSDLIDDEAIDKLGDKLIDQMGDDLDDEELLDDEETMAMMEDELNDMDEDDL